MEREPQTDILAKPRRRRLWNALLALIIFIAGVGVGSGLTYRNVSGHFKKHFQEPSTLADKITHRMKRRLDLTDEQTVQVRKILLENLKEFQSIRAKVRPQLEAQLEKTQNELEAVLTPEQSKKLELRIHELRKFWLPPEKSEQPAESQ
jgi:Spy/CpxP family protein refolding chaperone